MWIRTARHHFNLDKVTHTIISDNELHIYLIGDTRLVLKDEEAKQVLDYLDNISCPSWGLEVPEITEEYKES